MVLKQEIRRAEGDGGPGKIIIQFVYSRLNKHILISALNHPLEPSTVIWSFLSCRYIGLWPTNSFAYIRSTSYFRIKLIIYVNKTIGRFSLYINICWFSHSQAEINCISRSRLPNYRVLSVVNDQLDVKLFISSN